MPQGKRNPSLPMKTPDENLPEEVVEVLSGIPEEKRSQIVSFMSLQASMVKTPESEVAKKITTGHIDQMLKIEERAMENSFAEKESNRKHSLITLVLLIAFILLVILLLKDNSDLLETVLSFIFGGGLGAIGGYGYGISKKND